MPIFFAALLLLFISPLPSMAMEESKRIDNPEKVYVYVYHLKPPYIEQLELETGLYFELIELFNSFQDKYQFIPQFVPRKRLNREIANDTLDGMILGVHPVWFKDKEKIKFLWTKPLLNDRDEFISPVTKPFNYLGEVSLYNMNIGGVRGYHYFRVAPVLKKRKAKLTPTSSELQLLEMLIKKRLDVAVISRATLNYYFNLYPQWRDLVYFSKVPHEQYYRALLSPIKLESQFNIIESLFEQESFLAALEGLKAKYGFSREVFHK